MTPPPMPPRIVAELGTPSHWDVAHRLIRDRHTRCGDPEFVVAYLERVIAEEPHAHWLIYAEAFHQARTAFTTAWNSIRHTLTPAIRALAYELQQFSPPTPPTGGTDQ